VGQHGFRTGTSKIAALQLPPHFTAIFIDAIDDPERTGKQEVFEQILKHHGPVPEEVLVVGDDAVSASAPFKRFGLACGQRVAQVFGFTDWTHWAIREDRRISITC